MASASPMQFFTVSAMKAGFCELHSVSQKWIEDSQNLQQRDWKGSGKLLYSDSSTDYALITRYFDRDTGNWILAAGGLGMHGTEAAGDLLTDPELSRTLPEAVRSGSGNIQI